MIAEIHDDDFDLVDNELVIEKGCQYGCRCRVAQDLRRRLGGIFSVFMLFGLWGRVNLLLTRAIVGIRGRIFIFACSHRFSAVDSNQPPYMYFRVVSPLMSAKWCWVSLSLSLSKQHQYSNHFTSNVLAIPVV